jgi:crotonobetainyl-CoA:carnitine CoA-transferase CaiB-like acyl-CoA transferase
VGNDETSPDVAALGADTAKVLSTIGITAIELDQLRRDGVV